MNADDYKRLSQAIAHALRHKPESYGLAPDRDGWVPLSDLVVALTRKRREWHDLAAEDIRAMAAAADKQRYEITADHIRALYGHSFAGKIDKAPAVPPGQLYHGTTAAALVAIRQQGLRPMQRQYVHLSPDTATAGEVAKRRTAAPVIITVHAGAAHAGGVLFYPTNERVWLAESVPVQYLTFPMSVEVIINGGEK